MVTLWCRFLQLRARSSPQGISRRKTTATTDVQHHLRGCRRGQSNDRPCRSLRAAGRATSERTPPWEHPGRSHPCADPGPTIAGRQREAPHPVETPTAWSSLSNSSSCRAARRKASSAKRRLNWTAVGGLRYSGQILRSSCTASRATTRRSSCPGWSRSNRPSRFGRRYTSCNPARAAARLASRFACRSCSVRSASSRTTLAENWRRAEERARTACSTTASESPPCATDGLRWALTPSRSQQPWRNLTNASSLAPSTVMEMGVLAETAG